MPSLKYLPEALFFLSAGIAIFRWTARTAVDAMPPSEAESSPAIELPHMLPALIARGVAPPEEIARLTPEVRAALYHQVFDAEEAEAEAARRPAPGAGWRATCPRCDALLGAGNVPVGFLTHCPACGVELSKRKPV